MLKINSNKPPNITRGVKCTNSRHFCGFTLAEILITIGIIGVVAALTIPLLIQNSNSKKFTTQFKKSLSTLNQAAITAQAQYDMDYSLLSMVNEDSSCKSDTLAAGQCTLCGLFNNTLAAQTYLGKYGVVKAANGTSPYSASVSSFDISNFLFFSFADGALVAFNPNAKDCGVGVGNVITTDMLSGKLANCLGFIDVNGPTPPNQEIRCSDGAPTLSVNTTCKVTNGSMGDIFPIVFHDGAVEPATNAALAAFLGCSGKEDFSETPKQINYKNNYYNWNENIGKYVRTDSNGNFVTNDGNVYTKNSEGNYEYKGSNYTDVYDKDMNYLGRKYGGYWYDNKGEILLSDLGNGTYQGTGGGIFTKNSDGNWVNNNGYVLDENFKYIGRTYKGNWYEYKNGNFVREINSNRIESIDWKTLKVYNKNSEGYYVNNDIYYDKDLNIVGKYSSAVWYDYKGENNWDGQSLYLHDNGNGTYQSMDGSIISKNSDGLYVSNNGHVFDDEFHYLGSN